MNFTNIIKDEIMNQKIESDCCSLSFLYAIILTCGQISVKSGHFYLLISSVNESLLNFTLNIIKKIYGEAIEIESADETSFNKEKYELELSTETSRQIFNDLNLLDSLSKDKAFNFEFDSAVVANDCCVKSFLKGIFFASGTTNIKTSSVNFDSAFSTSQGYHIEIVFSKHSLASDVSGLLTEFGISNKIIERKGYFILYLSSFENIKTFLVSLNLNKSLFELEDESISREMRKKLNMEINLETANYNKQQIANNKQLVAINTIDQILGLENLDPALLEVAKLRLESPEESLVGLASKTYGQLSKSGINHRMRKIMQIYENLK